MTLESEEISMNISKLKLKLKLKKQELIVVRSKKELTL
jgi:hypothetical protein